MHVKIHPVVPFFKSFLSAEYLAQGDVPLYLSLQMVESLLCILKSEPSGVLRMSI